MLNLLSVFLALVSLQLVLADPSFIINSNQKVTGKNENERVESFKGIPFAEPPLRNLRFAPPIPFNQSYDQIQATAFKSSCMGINPVGVIDALRTAVGVIPFNNVLTQIIKPLEGVFTMADTNEDCLYFNIYRPAGTKPGDNLPVMVWFFGGAFVFGTGNTYDGTRYVEASIDLKEPVIVVTMNHRLAAWGFLGGKAVKNEGSGNVGLLDQRMVLEWIADHIKDVGGNPDKVTLFGESAGGMSIWGQMEMYDGDHTYNGKPLFHGAIMQSGSVLPLETIDNERSQKLADRFIKAAECDNRSDKDTMSCLRGKSTQELDRAMNTFSVFENFGILDMFVTWAPRADGKYIRDIPHKLTDQRKFAKVPIIIGDQEDEATLFAPILPAMSDADTYQIAKTLLLSATENDIQKLLALYPNDQTKGAPFRTRYLNTLTPQFKRLAGLLTDVLYHNNRRRVLHAAEGVDRYNYFATTLHNVLPFFGTTHANDLVWQWFLNLGPYKAYINYFLSFANHQDPNVNNGGLPNWPKYTNDGKDTLEIGFNSLGTTKDDFREEEIQYMIDNPSVIAF
ncbi:uncharacterized protein SAPINGB_P003759 [Magnusiomyces paraingens]|uniref:Carboxylesterase type B domain-containing protein n=1 Tax=Magnusiomyces paraingens TaxID=2606893 RepID=A0A5E8BWE5_9ASCO|nr:uncharacterized protein SAPINGB_P003759 [Saprochaete ingens]VVT53807.1 unnamed protein product [Saprochaete ingens]